MPINPVKLFEQGRKAIQGFVDNFKEDANAIPVGGMASPYQPADNAPEFYQVKKDDKSLSDISNNTGVPLQDIASMNNIKSLPPKGSYVQLRKKRDDLIKQGVPANVAGMISGTLNHPGANVADYRQFSPFGQAAPAAQALRTEASKIETQLAGGILPQTIPAGIVGFVKDALGVPMTIQDFIAEGYTMNANGALVRPTNAAAAGQVSPEFAATQAYRNNLNTPFLDQKRWDESTKKFVSIRKLLKQGKLDIKTGKSNSRGNNAYRNKRRTPAAPAAAPVVEQSRQGPDTILDIHLGSG